MFDLKLLFLLTIIVSVNCFNADRGNVTSVISNGQFQTYLSDFQKHGDVKDVQSCLAKIGLPAFNKCFSDAAKSWGVVFDSATHKLIGEVKKVCCGLWDVGDCVIKLAKDNKCDSADITAIDESIDKGTGIGVCMDYPRGSVKCHFPWWGIVLIVVGSLIVIGVIAFVVYRMRRR